MNTYIVVEFGAWYFPMFASRKYLGGALNRASPIALGRGGGFLTYRS